VTRSSTSAAKRMFPDLQNTRQSNVPFISAVTLNDNLGKISASIDGPPETLYECGIFWIIVKVPLDSTPAMPLIHSHTRIYSS